MTLRVTWNGRLVLTTGQAAEKYGMTAGGMRATIKRLGPEPVPETLDKGQPLYLATELDRVMKARPRPGVGGRPRQP